MSKKQHLVMCIDTLTHALLFLDAQSIILSCSLVSKQWNKISKSNTIWKLIYNQLLMNDRFGWQERIAEEALENTDITNNYWDDDDDEIMNNSKPSTTIQMKTRFDSDYEKHKTEKGGSGLITDTHWFDLFRELMDFPILNLEYLQLKNYIIGASDEEISNITDIEKLRKITFILKAMAKDDQNFKMSLDLQYKCGNPPRTEPKLRFNYLKLAIILAVVFGDQSISYFTDHVVISSRSSEEYKSEFVCPLPTFCMMILYPNALRYLPMKELDDLCVAPFIESESLILPVNNYDKEGNHDQAITNERGLCNKDCCFFTQMDDVDEISFNELIYNRNSSDEKGFEWCPRFFNAGGVWYLSKICASYSRDKYIQIRKYEDDGYY